MTVLSKILLFIIGLLLGGSLIIMPYINRLGALENFSEIKINNQIILAEAVSEYSKKTKGLAGKDEIGINEGMLFVFDKMDRYPFWMKGMKFPIDIIWIQNNIIVGFEENIQPQPNVKESELKIHWPPEPINKILEIRAGRIKLLNAQIGDLVDIKPLIKIASKF